MNGYGLKAPSADPNRHILSRIAKSNSSKLASTLLPDLLRIPSAAPVERVHASCHSLSFKRIDMMRFPLTIMSVVGALLVCWSLTLSAYKDERAYEVSYNSIDSLSPEASKQFAELRKKSLTDKFQIQDYGIVILTVGLIGLCLFEKKGWRISAPKNRTRFVVLGFTCVAVTAISIFTSMFLGLSRGDYPHWSDSAGIGIAQNAFLILIFLCWMVPHLLFLRGNFKVHQQIMLVPSVSTALLIVEGTLFLCGFVLSFIQADILAGSFLLWSYFFFALMSGKSG